jgi:hypothetical protein
MDDDERMALHARFLPHQTDGRCPFEASVSAFMDARSARLAAYFCGAWLAAAVVLIALFPHAKVEDPRTTAQMPFPAVVAVLTVVPLGVGGWGLRPLLRGRAETIAAARRGPTCDPWVELERDRRANLRVHLRKGVPNLPHLLGLRRT